MSLNNQVTGQRQIDSDPSESHLSLNAISQFQHHMKNDDEAKTHYVETVDSCESLLSLEAISPNNVSDGNESQVQDNIISYFDSNIIEDVDIDVLFSCFNSSNTDQRDINYYLDFGEKSCNSNSENFRRLLKARIEQFTRDFGVQHKILTESEGKMPFNVRELFSTGTLTGCAEKTIDFFSYFSQDFLRLGVLWYQMYRARGVLDIFAALSAFGLQVRDCECDAEDSKPMAIEFAEKLSLIVQESKAFKNKDSTVYTESFVDVYDDIVDCLLNFKSSDFYEAFRECIFSVLAMKVTTRSNAEAIYRIIGKPEKVINFCYFGIVESVLKGFGKLLRITDALWQGVPLARAMAICNPLSKTLQDVRETLLYKDFLYTGIPCGDGRKDKTLFVKELGAHIELLTDISKRIGGRSTEYMEVKKLLMECILIKNNISSTIMSGGRSAPIALVITGPPGIGKSWILKFLIQHYCKVRGLDPEKYAEMIYHRIASSPFWDNYDPWCHLAVHYSEPGTCHVDIAKMKGDPVVEELTSLIDELQFPVNMAFEQKGKVSAFPELVIIDTNTKYMNLDVTTNNPSAYKRRFIYIEPRVKPDFRRNDSTVALDADKSINAGGDAMDRWTFKVSREHANSNTETVKEVLMHGYKDDDIYALGDLLTGIYTKHFEDIERKKELLLGPRSSTPFEDLPEHDISDVESNNESIISESQTQVSDYSIDKFFVVGASGDLGYLLLSLLLFCYSFFSGWNKNVKKELGPWYYTFVKNFLIVLFGCWIYWFRPIQRFYSHFFYTSIFLNFAIPLSVYAIYQSNQVAYSLIRWKFCSKKFQYGVAAKFYYNSFKRRFRTKAGDVILDNYVYIQAIGAVVIAATITFKALEYYYSDRKQTESTTFVHKSQFDDKLNQIEIDTGCDLPIERIRVKNTNLWNTVELQRSDTRTRNTLDSVYTCILKNIRDAKVSVSDGRNIRTKILGVCGNYAIINHHAFKGSDKVTLNVALSGKNVLDSSSYYETIIDVTKLQKFCDDLSIVQLNHIQFKDILPYFPHTKFLTGVSTKAIVGCSLTTCQPSGSILVGDETLGEIQYSSSIKYKWSSHAAGSCGTPLLASYAGGSHIVGIHIGGGSDDNVGYSTAVCKQDIIDAIAHSDSISPYHKILSQANSFDTEMPIAKSAVNYEPITTFEILGKLPGKVHINNDSKLRPTGFNGIFEKVLGISSKDDNGTYRFQPPLMRPRVVNGEYVSPYNNALKKFERYRPALDDTVMAEVIDDIVNRITTRFKDRKIWPLDLETAINGSHTDAYCRAMRTNTAPGYPWQGLKSDYLPIVYEDEARVVRQPNTLLRESILKVLEGYRKGYSANFINKGSLKDEPRSSAKVAKGSTRVFYISPQEAVIIARMFLGPFYQLMVEDNETFCTAVGINMHSGADELVSKMDKFSKNILEGDMEVFDIGTPFQVSRASNTIVYRVCEAMGYNGDALIILNGILTDNLFSPFSLLLDVFSAPGYQPSGKYATAEDNSLKNLIELLYAWKHSEHRDKDFFTYVLLVTYGDDLSGAVKDACKSFNNLYYQKFCKDHYNLNFTTSDKGKDMKPFLSIDEASFLKRSFKYSELHKRWIAPLDKTSLLRSMTLYMPSNSVSYNEQLSGTLQSFSWEYFLHCETEAEYNTYRSFVVESLPQASDMLQGDVEKSIPTYFEISSAIFEN
jgi:hypothetical protein